MATVLGRNTRTRIERDQDTLLNASKFLVITALLNRGGVHFFFFLMFPILNYLGIISPHCECDAAQKELIDCDERNVSFLALSLANFQIGP